MSLQETDSIPGLPGVSVRFVDQLQSTLEGAAQPLLLTQAKPGSVLLAIPGIAKFLVTGGSTVEVAPEAAADPEAIALYLDGAVRATLIQQRGDIPLHAAALLPPGGDQAVALCGVSSVGKSTLACLLTQRGWRLLADDITHIGWSNGQAMVHPSDTRVKLWQDACKSLGMDRETLSRVRTGTGRFFVDVPAHMQPVPLGMVLEMFPRGDFEAKQVTISSDRVVMLGQHTVRWRQIAAMGMQPQHARNLMFAGTACVAGTLKGLHDNPMQEAVTLIEEALLWTRRSS